MQKKYSLCLKIKVMCLTDKNPEFYVRLNQIELANEKNQFNGYPTFGANTLEVIFLNKSESDTKIDKDGKIIEDLSVIIDTLTVDEIDISNNCKQYGIYTTQNNTVENTYGFLHKNGVFCYNFITPIFYHLRNKNLIHNIEIQHT